MTKTTGSVPSVMLFKSDAYPLDREGGDAATGKELAEVVRTLLEKSGHVVDVLGPGDGGWDLAVRLDEDDYRLFVHWAPLGRPAQDFWAIRVWRKRALGALFRSRRDDDVAPLVRELDRALADRTEMVSKRWITESYFEDLYVRGRPLDE